MLWSARQWVEPVLAWGGRGASGGEVYLATLRRLGASSARVTGFVQNGSLPVYASVIMATAAALPAGALVRGMGLVGMAAARTRARGAGGDHPRRGRARSRNRASPILRCVFLGVAGYAMAGLFVLSGAPDLALTQASVETLSTVVFVLVLRRLPERFERQSTSRRRAVRFLVATAVAAVVFVFALVAAGVRLSPTVSDAIVARSVPDGHGRNVVNVILVDFRGFDTLAEITVLATASIGAVALTWAGRRATGRRTTQPGVTHLRRPSARVRGRVGTAGLPRCAAHVGVVVVRRPQPTRRWFRGRAPGGVSHRASLHRWRHRRGSGPITLPALDGARCRPFHRHTSRRSYRSWPEVPCSTPGSPRSIFRSSARSTSSSALAFDVGVYLTVVGMVLMAFEAFGEDRVEETR